MSCQILPGRTHLITKGVALCSECSQKGRAARETIPFSMCLLHNNYLFKFYSAARAIRKNCTINKGDFMQDNSWASHFLKTGTPWLICQDEQLLWDSWNKVYSLNPISKGYSSGCTAGSPSALAAAWSSLTPPMQARVTDSFVEGKSPGNTLLHRSAC